MSKVKLILGLTGAALLIAIIVGVYPNVVTYHFENIGNGMDSRTGQAVRQDAQAVIQHVTEGSWMDLYQESATEIRDNNSVTDFAGQLEQYTRSFHGIDDVEIVEIILAELTRKHWMGSAYSIPPIVPSNHLPSPVSLNSPVVGSMAFVLCEAMTDNGKWPSWLTIQLKKEGARWRHLQLFISPSTVSGRNAEWFLKKAREFDSAGQHRNAHFYYLIAYDLHEPSTAIRTYLADEIRTELVTRTPINMPFPEQRPPEQWFINPDLTVDVFYVAPVATGEFLWLEVRYKTLSESVSSEEAVLERKLVYKHVIETFPEYQDAFGGIFIGSVHENGQGYRDGFPFDKSNASRPQN